MLLRSLPPLISPRLRGYIYPYRQAQKDNYTFRTASQAGLEFQGSTSDPQAYSFGVNGYYDWRNLAVAAAVCREGDTVIEVGANVGTETVGFAGLVGRSGRVVAFEPSPCNVAALSDTLALNPEFNVTLLPDAVGDTCRRLRFFAPDGKEDSGLGHIAVDENMSDSRHIEVECRTLDSLTDDLGRARLLAIDVEGFEVPVLVGAQAYISSNYPVIIVEAAAEHQKRVNGSLECLYKTLGEMGYRVRVIGKLGVLPVDLSDRAKGGNWLCVHERETGVFEKVTGMIRRAGFLPAIPGMNPICRRPRVQS